MTYKVSFSPDIKPIYYSGSKQFLAHCIFCTFEHSEVFLWRAGRVKYENQVSWSHQIEF